MELPGKLSKRRWKFSSVLRNKCNLNVARHFLENNRVSVVEEQEELKRCLNSEWASLAGDHVESLRRG